MTPDGADLPLPSEREIAKGLAESAVESNPRPPPGKFGLPYMYLSSFYIVISLDNILLSTCFELRCKNKWLCVWAFWANLIVAHGLFLFSFYVLLNVWLITTLCVIESILIIMCKSFQWAIFSVIPVVVFVSFALLCFAFASVEYIPVSRYKGVYLISQDTYFSMIFQYAVDSISFICYK